MAFKLLCRCGEKQFALEALRTSAAGNSRLFVPRLHPVGQPAQAAVTMQRVGTDRPVTRQNLVGVVIPHNHQQMALRPQLFSNWPFCLQNHNKKNSPEKETTHFSVCNGLLCIIFAQLEAEVWTDGTLSRLCHGGCESMALCPPALCTNTPKSMLFHYDETQAHLSGRANSRHLTSANMKATWLWLLINARPSIHPSFYPDFMQPWLLRCLYKMSLFGLFCPVSFLSSSAADSSIDRWQSRDRRGHGGREQRYFCAVSERSPSLHATQKMKDMHKQTLKPTDHGECVWEMS